MNKVARSIKRFVQIPFSEKRLFAEALLLLFTTKLILVFFPFKTCIRLFTKKITQSDPTNIQQLRQIKTALDRANRLAFWKNVCIVQSFAARWMLNRRGISSKLSIGVMYDNHKKLLAHAWIITNEIEIVTKNSNFLELTTI